MLFEEPAKLHLADMSHQGDSTSFAADIDLSDNPPSKLQQMLTFYRDLRIDADPFEFTSFAATAFWLADLQLIFDRVGVDENNHDARMWLVRQVVADSAKVQMADSAWPSSSQENFERFS